MKTFIILSLIFISNLSASAFATTYKCSSNSINPDVIRHEVEFSFDPLVFRLNEFFKEDDGSWSLDSETLADATGILKPVKIQWPSCKTKLNSSSTEISYEWSKGTLAAGYIVLNLTSGKGEFYSSIQTSGTVSRRVQFSECVEKTSK